MTPVHRGWVFVLVYLHYFRAIVFAHSCVSGTDVQLQLGARNTKVKCPPTWTESLLLKYLSLLCCFCTPLPIFYVIMNLPGRATVYTLNTSRWDLCGASHLCFVVICVLKSQTWVWLVQCQSTFVLYFTNEYLIALSAQVPVAFLHWCAPTVSSCQPADFFSLQCKHSLGAVKEH